MPLRERDNEMLPDRKSTRLREYDYRGNGAYAITICVYERKCALGKIENGVLRLHPFGQIAHQDWLDIPFHYSNVRLDEFIVMPNHLHGILWIEGEAPPSSEEEIRLAKFGEALSGTLGLIIGSYKSGVARRIGQLRHTKTKVWQRGFYEHIIRHDRDLTLQREYIHLNPSQWADDEFNTG